MKHNEEKQQPTLPSGWDRCWTLFQRALVALNQQPGTDGFLLEFDRTVGQVPWKLSLAHNGRLFRYENADLGTLFSQVWENHYQDLPKPSQVDRAWGYLDSIWRRLELDQAAPRRVSISAPRNTLEQFYSVTLSEGSCIREWLLPTLDTALLDQVARDFDARRDRHRR